MSDFIHLHNHSQYSLLDGASSIEDMLDKAARDGQKGVALTDHGNMFGAFKFVSEANKRGLKPIIGCEFYLVEDRHKKVFKKSKGEKDKRYHQLLLAKNATGYQNLIMLCSLGYIEGHYSKFPRIDHELIEKYSEGLIATSCCIAAEVPQAIIHSDYEKAEKKLKWWLDIFGEDYYIEIMRHRGLENISITNNYGQRKFSGVSQNDVNNTLLQFANKYNINVIATNDSHYVEEEDWFSHDILLCVNTGNQLSDPKGEGKGKRFSFSSSDYFFKTQDEMKQLFHDVPQAIGNTMEIYDKVEKLKLERDVLLPKFAVPSQFKSEIEYLRYLTYQGAKKKYKEITEVVRERLDFELDTIEKIGYPGYFLIVQDFTTAAKERGVAVGPGRGSAAGSAVAYCLGITNIDPIEYDLLFERFLNPERISLPDIDIDFDDEGRQEVIDYVVDKYSFDHVAQIVTYGTMKAKSAVKDVGRVMGVSLSSVAEINKKMPDISLKKLFNDEKYNEKKGSLRPDEVKAAEELRRQFYEEDPEGIGEMLRYAKKLENSIRNIGIHACGVVITPGRVHDYIPVCRVKDNNLLVTQFDNSVAETAGLLKMDFLGLKTLSIIKDAIALIEENHGVTIDPNDIPLNDENTYKLFQDGHTIGIFQFESDGMRKYMKELKPTEFSDLIAMNALYRPGPMQYIPKFIDRKHGREEIVYDLPVMEEILKDTYGITVYQEQVMLLSQKLASFSKGEADSLRKGMGKKKKDVIDKLYPKFIEGGKANGHPEKILNKIWKDWEAFAEYAFNKSHSTSYTYISFTTAYLKANYPSEFLASVLTHSKNDIAKVSFFLREARKMGIEIQPPHINTSKHTFSVNSDGDIIMGLSALKNVGNGPVDAIIEARKDGEFKDIYDFVKRVDVKAVSKRVMEALAYAGALDNFGFYRSQFVFPYEDNVTFISKLLKYGLAFQDSSNAAQQSLFAGMEEMTFTKPEAPDVEEFILLKKLNYEKEYSGLYVSGHPLDDYALEYKLAVNTYLSDIEDNQEENKVVSCAGIITNSIEMITKRGNPMGKITLQDYRASHEFVLFDEDYKKFKHLLDVGTAIAITGAYTRKYSKQPLRFKITDIKLLSSMSTQKLKAIKIQLNIEKIDNELIAILEQLIDKSIGNHSVEVELTYNNFVLPMKSFDKFINIDTELVKTLKSMDIPFNLN